MKRKLSFILIIAVLIVALSGAIISANGAVNVEHVAIENKGTHYEVILNFNSEKSHENVGKEYGAKILKSIPDYEAVMDSYIAEVAADDDTYDLFMKRVNDIKPQIDKAYCDEIRGIASNFTGKDQDIRGDGKLSTNEMFLMNLCPDVARPTQCCAMGVYGDRTKTNDNIGFRILDWYEGSQSQLAKIQAVVVFKNSKKSICTIGYLGYMGCISGFNDNKVFGAILDSGTGEPYTSQSERSYPLDLRHALEHYTTIDGVASYLKSPVRNYTYGHLIFFSDSKVSKVLENNISGKTNSLREVRTEKSEFNDGITWDIDNSLGTVNSYLLKGNLDNQKGNPYNTERFNSMKSELKGKGDKLMLNDIKKIASFYRGEAPGLQEDGDLYNVRTQQIIVFEPSKCEYQVFFRPVSGILPKVPVFEKISVSFDK